MGMNKVGNFQHVKGHLVKCGNYGENKHDITSNAPLIPSPWEVIAREIITVGAWFAAFSWLLASAFAILAFG